MFYTACVENRMDPLKLGRCQVRIVGLHTDNKVQLPTLDLPWAYPMGSVTSASMSGLGWSPTGLVQGTWVIVIFLDSDQQQPIMIGTLGGIPQTKSAAFVGESLNSIVVTDDDGAITTASGGDIEDIIDSVAEEVTEGTLMETGEKYHINAITKQVSNRIETTYVIKDNTTNVTKATVTFNALTAVYSVTLLNPELYTFSQYVYASKDYSDTTEILTYFDKNI